MAKRKKATEYDLLRLFVREMEQHGVTRNHVRFDIDQDAANLMNERLGTNVTLEQIQRFADKCLAHEWLEHVFLGAGQYGALSLTASGHGVVRSLQIKETAKAKRSTLKKVSDFIEDHKGISAAIGVLIAIVGLLLKKGSGS